MFLYKRGIAKIVEVLLLLFDMVEVLPPMARIGKNRTYLYQGRKTYNVVNCIFYDVFQP